MCRGMKPLLIEPIEDGDFESYAVVAEGMICLDLDMCGLRIPGLLEGLEQCFAIRTSAVVC